MSERFDPTPMDRTAVASVRTGTATTPTTPTLPRRLLGVWAHPDDESSKGAATVAAYEAYLNQVQAMVAEERKKVAQLEALKAKYAVPAAPLSEESDLGFQHTMDPNISEEQAGDEVAILDRELDSSLAAFDSMLLKELELIRARSAERMRDLAEDVAAAAARIDPAAGQMGAVNQKGIG